MTRVRSRFCGISRGGWDIRGEPACATQRAKPAPPRRSTPPPAEGCRLTRQRVGAARTPRTKERRQRDPSRAGKGVGPLGTSARHGVSHLLHVYLSSAAPTCASRTKQRGASARAAARGASLLRLRRRLAAGRTVALLRNCLANQCATRMSSAVFILPSGPAELTTS